MAGKRNFELPTQAIYGLWADMAGQPAILMRL
jgi:hypothetical protein